MDRRTEESLFGNMLYWPRNALDLVEPYPIDHDDYGSNDVNSLPSSAGDPFAGSRPHQTRYDISQNLDASYNQFPVQPPSLNTLNNYGYPTSTSADNSNRSKVMPNTQMYTAGYIQNYPLQSANSSYFYMNQQAPGPQPASWQQQYPGPNVLTNYATSSTYTWTTTAVHPTSAQAIAHSNPPLPATTAMTGDNEPLKSKRNETSQSNGISDIIDDSIGTKPNLRDLDNSSDLMDCNRLHPFKPSLLPNPDMCKSGRRRKKFTSDQLFELENFYIKNQVLWPSKLIEIANHLQLKPKAVQTWFYYRRELHKMHKKSSRYSQYYGKLFDSPNIIQESENPFQGNVIGNRLDLNSNEWNMSDSSDAE